ncbi:MAG: hypothetical protein ABWW69_06575 [Pyrodictiaceae archaeon]
MIFKRRRKKSLRVALLEAVVSARLASTNLSILANRLKRLRRMSNDNKIDDLIRRVTGLQITLEAIALRLETLASTGIVSSEDLSIVYAVLRKAIATYKSLSPEVAPMLDEVVRSIVEAAEIAGIELYDENTPVVAQGVNELYSRINSSIAAKLEEDKVKG